MFAWFSHSSILAPFFSVGRLAYPTIPPIPLGVLLESVSGIVTFIVPDIESFAACPAATVVPSAFAIVPITPPTAAIADPSNTPAPVCSSDTLTAVSFPVTAVSDIFPSLRPARIPIPFSDEYFLVSAFSVPKVSFGFRIVTCSIVPFTSQNIPRYSGLLT